MYYYLCGHCGCGVDQVVFGDEVIHLCNNCGDCDDVVLVDVNQEFCEVSPDKNIQLQNHRKLVEFLEVNLRQKVDKKRESILRIEMLNYIETEGEVFIPGGWFELRHTCNTRFDKKKMFEIIRERFGNEAVEYIEENCISRKPSKCIHVHGNRNC